MLHCCQHFGNSRTKAERRFDRMEFKKGHRSILTAAGGLLAGLLLITGLLAMNPESVRAGQAYGYFLPASGYSYIDESTVSSWPAQALNYAKNEIYARNGRRFASAELQGWFDQQYWYTPIYSPDQFSDSMLNEYETSNIAMLTAREQELGTYALDQAGYSYSNVYPYLASTGDEYYVNPDTYIFYDSNTRLLTDADVSQLSPQELCYARNEIYARRGYIFASTELSDYFHSKNWYWGTVDASAFSDSVFNSAETANISLLQKTEYAKQANGYALDMPGYSYSSIGSYSSENAVQATAGDYIFYDSAVRNLTQSELAGLSLQQLCYARNEIYARRGYIFQSQELRDYFGSKSWYYPTIPADSFSAQVFNSFETQNIELLKNYEYSINPNGYQLY